MLKALENVDFVLSALEVVDSDVGEKITSQLALEDWTGVKVCLNTSLTCLHSHHSRTRTRGLVYEH